MTDLVRVAITDDSVRLSWPPRCPRCGDERASASSTSRVGRVKSLRPNLMGGFTMRSDVMYVSVPMCERHAASNSTANKLLEKSPLMTGLRGLSYVGALFLVEMLVTLAIGRGAWARLQDLGAFLLFPAFGALGCAAIWWARNNTAVWPKRFDPDMDVLEIQFSDDRYARHFRRANRDATDQLLTAAPPWYMRSLVWKIAAVALLFAWLAHLMR